MDRLGEEAQGPSSGFPALEKTRDRAEDRGVGKAGRSVERIGKAVASPHPPARALPRTAATIGGNVHARRTGFAHVIYNSMTGIAAFLLLSPFPWQFDCRAAVTVNVVVPGGVTPVVAHPERYSCCSAAAVAKSVWR